MTTGKAAADVVNVPPISEGMLDQGGHVSRIWHQFFVELRNAANESTSQNQGSPFGIAGSGGAGAEDGGINLATAMEREVKKVEERIIQMAMGRGERPEPEVIDLFSHVPPQDLRRDADVEFGGIATSISTKTNDYTITAADSTILIDGSSNTVTITLPTAVGIAGRKYNIKCLDDTFACGVAGAGAETIDGESTQTLNQYDNMCIQSDGAEWWIL